MIKTEGVRSTDYLPVPDAIGATEDLRSIDVLPYLADTELSVFAEAPILQSWPAADDCNSLPFSSAGICKLLPNSLRCVAAYKVEGSRFACFGSWSLRLDFWMVMRWTPPSMSGQATAVPLADHVTLSDSTLELFGYYIAEGNRQDQYIT